MRHAPGSRLGSDPMPFLRHPVSLIGFACLCVSLWVCWLLEARLERKGRTKQRRIVSNIKWCVVSICAVAMFAGECIAVQSRW